MHFTTRANSMKRRTENAIAAARRRAMHEAAGAPPQLTNGACAAAQSTGAAASRLILRARPLALRVHRERAIVDKSTDLWAADLHVGRALRKDNRGPRMLARTRTRRASCRPGGGRPSSPPERPCPGSAIRGGAVSVRASTHCLPPHLRLCGFEPPPGWKLPASILRDSAALHLYQSIRGRVVLCVLPLYGGGGSALPRWYVFKRSQAQ